MNPPASAPARPKQGSQSPADGWSVQPQRIKRHRTAGDVFKGLGALLVLAVLLGAIPVALIRYIGWPLPHHLPSAHFFNQSITPQVLLNALAVIVWLAWAQFAACVVVEFLAAIRGVGMPTRVPAAGPSQFLARQLVAALLMITASAASFVPNLAHLGNHDASPLAAPPAATAGVLPGSSQHHAIAPAHLALPAGRYNYNLPAVRGESGLRVAGDSLGTLSDDSTKLYRVQPPLGRHHDTLWEIAQRHLGDGRRYREIYALNKDRVQPDGSKLTNAALIRPGWILMMPADATGGDLVIEMPPTPPDNTTPIQSGSTQSDTIHPDAAQSTPHPDAPQSNTASQHTNAPSPNGHTPTAQPPTAQPPNVQAPNGQTPNGQAATAQAPNGQAPNGQATNGQAPNGQVPTGQAPNGQPQSTTTGPTTTGPTATGPTTTGPTTTGPTATGPTATGPTTTGPSPTAMPSQTAPSALKLVPSAAPPPLSHIPAPPRTSTATPAVKPPADPAVKQSAEVAKLSPVTQSADELAKVATAAAALADPSHKQLTAPPPQLPAAPQPDTPALTPADQSTTDQAHTTTTDANHSAPAETAATSNQPTTTVADAALALVHQDTTTTAGTASTSTTTTTDDTSAASTTTTIAGPLSITRSSHRGAHSPEESQPPSTDNRVLFGLAASPLLAAGLLKAIGRHRRRQLWNRVFGRRPATPTGDGAVAEESIRVGASEVEVWFLDLALRGLSAGLAERGVIVPGAYAVRLRDEGIELLLNKPVSPDDPAAQPPAPWFTAADGRSWNFPRPGIVDVDAQAAHRRFAPYPGLVTIGATISAAGGSAIGADVSDRLMIDLEEARGLIGLDGPPEIRRAVLAALAVELATNSWSDRMTVTLVGFPGDLTPLAPARVRHVRTLDEILPSLETEAIERAKALAAAGLESVLDGRSRASQASSFPPHFVLVSEEPHAAILARLSAIATTAARVGLGLVVAGDLHGATWQLTVGSDRRIAAPALGIEAQAQLLPEEHYAAVLGLFRAVCDIEGTDVAATPAHQSVGYGGPLPDEAPSVYAALLGPLLVTGIEQMEPERAPLLNEALVFLLHHRDGVHPRVLAAALWPRGNSADIAEATFARLATWLGTDPHGKPNLHTDTEGRLRLGPYVWSDWDVFLSLQSRALYDASIPDQKQRDDMLKRALDLVRGPYLADCEPNRFGWLAYEVAEAQVPAVIADTALQLADSCIASDEPNEAIEAVKAGMRGSPDDEELWRGLLRATSATQDTERLRGAIEGLYKRTWYVHGVQGLHPRTEALVNELMPDWREVVAA